MNPSLGRDELVINEQPYKLFEQAGRRQWQVRSVASQPGDAIAKPHFLSAHGGFGASQRHLLASGNPSDPTHHDYSINMNATNESVIMPSAKITYADLSSVITTAAAFRIGGYANSVVGGNGAGIGAVGGGAVIDHPQQIIEYGDHLYVLCGSRSVVVDPDLATPAVVEGRNHGNSARARSGDVFNGRLVVALGNSVEADVAISAYTSVSPTVWSTATGVQMSVFKRGKAGRLFSAQNHKVYNVLPGNDPAQAANYLPSAGEVITDQSDPVRSLIEYYGGLVAGTAKTARTIDPDRGFEPVAVIPESRLSSSDYDGRASVAIGATLLHATSGGVFAIMPGQEPILVGPEEMENNDSPYINGEPGVPDFAGEYLAWPYYFPSTGDSVIFLARRRRPDEQGTGAYVWYDHLYLSGRVSRAVYFWGGSDTYGPRLFFGAGTAANPTQLGWIDWREADASPAMSSTLYWPMDDFGQPGVTLEVDRVEMPNVENADPGNYAVWSVQPNGGSYVDLINGDNRVDETGFQAVYVPAGQTVSGRGLKFRLVITQEATAPSFFKIRGNPIAYIAARPSTVSQVTTLFDVESQSVEDAEEVRARLHSLVGKRVKLETSPSGDSVYIRIESAQTREIEVRSGGGDKSDRRLVVEAVWREIAVA